MGPLYVLLEKCLFRFFAHFLIRSFVFLEWSHVSSLDMLEIKPLSKVSLANIFTHSVGSLFMEPTFHSLFLLMFSLAMQKLFILMKSPLFILSFMALALEDIPVKILLHGISEIFLSMLSSRTSMALQLIFKSFIHLDPILGYGISWWSSFFFFFLHVAVHISQHHLLKRLFLLHFILLPPLSNIN